MNTSEDDKTHTRYNRICFAHDLVDDEKQTAEYIDFHKPENSWLQVAQNMVDDDNPDMEIYSFGENYVRKITENDDHGKSKENEWQEVMRKHQKSLPWAKSGEKWTRFTIKGCTP